MLTTAAAVIPRGVHTIDRWKQDASWKKLGEVKKENLAFEQKNAWSQSALNCTKFGKLILRKIIKIVATRCHILKLKCTKFDCDWSFASGRWGSLQCSPRTPSWIQGACF